MSVQVVDSPELLEEADLDKFFTVFEGSSPDDVCHARQLWSSVTMLPPLESRLVSADIRQRLPVCRPKRASAPQVCGPRCSVPELQPSLTPHEERRRYEAMADQRREILALLGRQRDQRIRNEMVSQAVKHKGKPGREKLNNKPSRETETETEKDLVKQLQ